MAGLIERLRLCWAIMSGRHMYVTRAEFHEALHHIHRRIDHMASQAEVDQIVQQLLDDQQGLAAVDQKLHDATDKLQAELDNLQAQIDAGGAVNLDALRAIPGQIADATSALSSHADAVGGLTPTPAPEPAPAPDQPPTA